jgi:hypothetical protein
VKVTSDFAILDVKKGRKKLFKLFDKRPPQPGFPVVIRGRLDRVHGDDDGTSREFQVTVDSVKLDDDDEPFEPF